MTADNTKIGRLPKTRTHLPKWLRSLLHIAVIYLVCHELSELSLIFPPGGAYPHLIWLTEGANLAALILFGAEGWVGVLLAQWVAGTGLTGAICSVVSCTLRLALAQWILVRLQFNPRMERLRDLFLLIVMGGGVAAGVGTLAGGLLISGTGFIPANRFWMDWGIWWIGDLAGILILTPLILTWAVPAQRKLLSRRCIEFCVLLAMLLASNQWLAPQSMFSASMRYPLSYPLIPLLIWAALRVGPIGVTTAGLAIFTQTLVRNWSDWQAAANTHALTGLPLPMIQVSFAWLMALVLAFAVHALHRAREVVKVNHDALSALIETSPLAIVVVGPEGKIQHWNRAAHAIFGWPRAEMIGRPIPPLAWEELRTVFDAAFAGNSTSYARTGRFRRDGAMIDLHIDAAPIYAGDGTIAAAVAIIADVTTQRRMEESLQQRQHLEALGRLAGGIAHDFNNILAVILGQAELLLTEVARPRIRQRIAQLRSAVLQASSLTSRLLSFSRQQRFEPTLLDLNQILMISKDSPGGKEIELSLRLDHGACPVHADPVQIEQLMSNLIMNARDPSSRGWIEIETRTTAFGWEETEVSQWTVLTARYGSQVLPAGRDRVHPDEKSVRRPAGIASEPSSACDAAGYDTGLGLAIVHGIVRQLGGSMRVWSEVGQETRIEIWFPAAATGIAGGMMGGEVLVSGS